MIPENAESKRAEQREKIAEMRACHVRKIALLSSRMMHSCCDAAEAADGKIIPIEEVSDLPFKMCDAEECGCLWTAEV